MPETKPEPKKNQNGNAPGFLSFILSELSDKAEKLLKRLGEFVIFKKILKKYAAFIAMMTAALITILYGLGTLTGSFFPSLKPGLTHIFIGIALAAIAMAYRELNKGDD